VALRSHFASARFQGRFFGSRWPWWRGGLVFGWIGPVFWPYADYDFFDYVWPSLGDGRLAARLSVRVRSGLHISDHRLAALVHMHMLDADDLRAAVSQAP
jgi:hypothetical protein